MHPAVYLLISYRNSAYIGHGSDYVLYTPFVPSTTLRLLILTHTAIHLGQRLADFFWGISPFAYCSFLCWYLERVYIVSVALTTEVVYSFSGGFLQVKNPSKPNQAGSSDYGWQHRLQNSAKHRYLKRAPSLDNDKSVFPLKISPAMDLLLWCIQCTLGYLCTVRA